MCSTNFKIVFNVIVKNQLVVFAKQSVVYISSIKNQSKTDLKRVGIEKLARKVYIGSLFTKSYIWSSTTTENSLSNQKP